MLLPEAETHPSSPLEIRSEDLMCLGKSELQCILKYIIFVTANVHIADR